MTPITGASAIDRVAGRQGSSLLAGEGAFDPHRGRLFYGARHGDA